MSFKRNKGYTLIEILIVVFIISIVSRAALLSIGHNRQKQVETVANELNQVLTLATEQAILMPAVIGVSFQQQGVHFLTPVLHDKKKKWQPFDDRGLTDIDIPKNIVIKVSNQQTKSEEDEEKGLQPDIIISTNGDMTPFTIYIGQQGESPTYALSGEEDGSLITKALS